jgi:hypothetical protein
LGRLVEVGNATAGCEVVVYADLGAAVALGPEEVFNQRASLPQESGEPLQRLLHVRVDHHVGVEGDNRLAPVEFDLLPIL